VRPQEEYDITLNMLKVDINKPLKDEQFVLQQPPGADCGAYGPSAIEFYRVTVAGRGAVGAVCILAGRRSKLRLYK